MLKIELINGEIAEVHIDDLRTFLRENGDRIKLQYAKMHKRRILKEDCKI